MYWQYLPEILILKSEVKNRKVRISKFIYNQSCRGGNINNLSDNTFGPICPELSKANTRGPKAASSSRKS